MVWVPNVWGKRLVGGLPASDPVRSKGAVISHPLDSASLAHGWSEARTLCSEAGQRIKLHKLPDLYRHRLTPHVARDEILRPCFITVTCVAGPLSHAGRHLDPLCPSLARSHGFYRLVRTLKSSSSMGASDFRHATSTPRPGQRTERASWMGGRSFRRDMCRVIALAAPRVGCVLSPKTMSLCKATAPRRVNHRPLTAGEINLGKLWGNRCTKGLVGR